MNRQAFIKTSAAEAVLIAAPASNDASIETIANIDFP